MNIKHKVWQFCDAICIYTADEAQRVSNLYPSVADDTPAPIGFESQGK